MNKWLNLIKFEIESYLCFPTLEFILVLAILLMLSSPISNFDFATRFQNLRGSYITIFLFFVTFSVGAIFSHSFAGSIARGETKLLLSYPIRRGELFISKFLGLFFVLLMVLLFVVLLNSSLLAIGFFDSAAYSFLFGIILQLGLVSAITVFVSLITKNEIITILVSVLSLFSLENMASNNAYLSGVARLNFVCNYFNPSQVGANLEVTATDSIIVIIAPILVSVILIGISFMYFTRWMQLD